MARLHRRNFLPTVIVNLILWIVCGLIILFLNPQKIAPFQISNFKFQIFPNICLFFLVLTLSLTLTLALLFGNTRRGFLTSIFIVSILILKLLKIFYWWSILTSFILTLTIELYFSFKAKNKIAR